MVKHIPNFITSLNLAAGFLAIIFILNGEPVAASWIILLAMVFDFLDGFASRILKAYSVLGKELDSLADLVSFGVAPGLIIYKLLTNSVEQSALISANHPELKIFLIAIIPSLIPVCAGLRLAKFNIDETQSTLFRGLPTPAVALAIVSVILSSAYSGNRIIGSLSSSPVFIIAFTICASALMVSRIPLLSFKFKTWGFKGNEGRYVLLAVVVILVIVMKWTGIPIIVPAYIIVSLFLRN